MPSHSSSSSPSFRQNSAVFVDLEKLNRSQLLQVLVNSPVAHTMLYSQVIIPGSDYLNNEPKLRDDSVMSKWFPTFVEIIGHERDQYMSSTLLKVASENSSVVAVVGRAHLQGIKKHWKQPVVMKDLMTVPSVEPAVSAIRILRSVGVVVAAVAIISGIEITVIRDDGVAGLVIISSKK